MIIECSECGTKNTTDKTPQLGKRYRCGKCGAAITILQTADTLQETNNLPIAGRSKCRYCGAYTVGKVRGLQGIGEAFIAIFLCFMGLIPGIIYYIYIESVPYCSGCGRRVRK